MQLHSPAFCEGQNRSHPLLCLGRSVQHSFIHQTFTRHNLLHAQLQRDQTWGRQRWGHPVPARGSSLSSRAVTPLSLCASCVTNVRQRERVREWWGQMTAQEGGHRGLWVCLYLPPTSTPLQPQAGLYFLCMCQRARARDAVPCSSLALPLSPRGSPSHFSFLMLALTEPIHSPIKTAI